MKRKPQPLQAPYVEREIERGRAAFERREKSNAPQPPKPDAFDTIKQQKEAESKKVVKFEPGQILQFNGELETRKNPSGMATSLQNTLIVLTKLEIDCRYDVFHNQILVEGRIENLEHVCLLLRTTIISKFRFDPGEHIRAAVVRMALEHQFDPVVDYLDGLRWDGVKGPYRGPGVAGVVGSAPGVLPGSAGSGSNKSREAENSVEKNEQPESDDAFKRRVIEAYGSLDHPQAIAMLEARAKQKAPDDTANVLASAAEQLIGKKVG